ncbi:MAG: hypothetical protein QOE70_5534 [Chthoniobacter sp.]|jgi:uncharacterized protein (TIGR02599 family)|nr:hypothetical protein [Chthoniobacter sp.]
MMRSRSSTVSGFTLVELMVSMAILIIIIGIMVAATDQAGQLARRTTGKIEQFQEARHGFEKMTRRLSEATLNTYWDYYDVNNKVRDSINYKDFTPVNYGRQSELRFRSGSMTKLLGTADSSVYRPTHGIFFQAPVGEVEDRPPVVTPQSNQDKQMLDETLNTWGFFLEIASDKEFIPPFLVGLQKERIRSRMLELRQSTETLNIYKETAYAGNPDPMKWFTKPLLLKAGQSTPRPVRILAENVVALIMLPRLSQNDERLRTKSNKAPLSLDYEYDSTATKSDPEINPKNQLPPVVQVVMVAVDEISARRLIDRNPGAKDLGVKTDDLFTDSRLLEDNAKTTEPGDGDLHTLETRLLDQHATYRIFSTNVAIRGAKWSKAQTK